MVELTVSVRDGGPEQIGGFDDVGKLIRLGVHCRAGNAFLHRRSKTVQVHRGLVLVDDRDVCNEIQFRVLGAKRLSLLPIVQPFVLAAVVGV